MTTKNSIAEQALRRLAKGDVPRDFHIHIRELTLMIPQIISYLSEQSYYEKLRAEGIRQVDTRLLSVFDDQPVAYDEAKDLKYTVIPAAYVDNLPDDMGLFHVGPMKGHNKKFKRVSPAFLAMYDGLEAGGLAGHVGYWVEGERIYYTHPLNGPDYDTKTVLIKLIASYQDKEDDEEINVPLGLQFKIIETLVKFFDGTNKELKDRVNDNLPQA